MSHTDTGRHSPTYRVGLVGCGAIADQTQDVLAEVPGWIPFPYSHAPALAAHERTELVAAVDPDSERLERFCTRWSVDQCFTDIDHMLERCDLDIVVIASPTRHHASAFLAASAAGVRGVFLEKPMAQTLADADAMIAAAARSGTSAVINHFRSFDPSYRKAAQLIRDGAIGSVTGAVVVWGEGIAQGGCHLFDLLRLLLGSPVDWVFADVDDDVSLVDPGGTFLLALRHGVRVTVHMPWTLNAPVKVEVIGTRGHITLTHYERTLTRYEIVNDRAVPLHSPMPLRAATRSGMLVALDELILQMETGVLPSSGLPEGRMALEISGALLESGRRGAVVRLPFEDHDAVIQSWL